MKEANRRFLDANRHHHTTLIKAFYMRHLDGATREGMVRVINEEFQSGYRTDLWCAPCVADMVRKVYRHYDEWLASQPKDEPVVDVPVTPTTEGEPVNQIAVIAATFPSHKEVEPPEEGEMVEVAPQDMPKPAFSEEDIFNALKVPEELFGVEPPMVVDHPASTPEVINEPPPPGPLDRQPQPNTHHHKKKRRSR